ncbi:DUF866-domain-containing protein, partial [Pholiota conissans]
RLQLSIKAELENITNLEPANKDFEFFFQVKCSSCNETHPKFVSLNLVEERVLSGAKGGTAHFIWRCGLCKRESSAKFESTAITPYGSENAQFRPLLIIECRGLEFTDFDPRGIWKCEGTTGTKFPEVDLVDKEWNDYDEKANLPVGISEFESRFDRAH